LPETAISATNGAMKTSEKICVVGLGYVGLPLAIALSKQFERVIGFDINSRRIDQLKNGVDITSEADAKDLENPNITFTDTATEAADATFYIVTVPTPIDHDKRPDLTPLIKSSQTVGAMLKKGDIVVYESTVYPGLTEEICLPILEEVSKLEHLKDFNIGYSPERINPGDKVNTLANIMKVISADTPETQARLKEVYGSVITAGLHEAPSIKAAEAAKVIENTQRDLNIALMNELAVIFERMDLKTTDVIEAAGTKWNFLKFYPGLVGGHCIGVDPFYITAKAEQLGYHPQVILAGRRINDDMGRFVARKTVKMLSEADCPLNKARVGILGLTFKENVGDIRNSQVPSIAEELKEYNMDVLVHDPFADEAEVKIEYGLALNGLEEFKDLDALILAVPHNFYVKNGFNISHYLKKDGVFVDVKTAMNDNDFPEYKYWSL